MNMTLIVNAVLLFSMITFAVQDIVGGKSCDCSICNAANNKLSGVVGSKVNHGSSESKSSCSICEKKKEIQRMERERQRKLQKCPFEILGASSLKGKSSQEIFDEFRELIVPSQNGFFDMMRGIVKTMHVSSEAELKWAKEKEAKELARKKEELKKMKEANNKKEREELVNLQSPINPKVTVILKQTPCGQILAPSETKDPEKLLLSERFPKDLKEDFLKIPEEDHLQFQPNEITENDQTAFNYMNVNSQENLLHSDLIDQLIGFNKWSTIPPSETIGNTETEAELTTLEEENNFMKSSTESPFVKFVSDDELKAQWKNSRNSDDDVNLNFNLLPISNGEKFQEADENLQSID